MKSFKAKIEIIGINPYVYIPEPVLEKIFEEAGKKKGPIPVKGLLNGEPFKQTLVRYQGHWRLYLNTPMREAADLLVGDIAKVELRFNPTPPAPRLSDDFTRALEKSKKAKLAFEKLTPSHQREIHRYLHGIKTPETLEKNLKYVMQFLTGKIPDGLHAVLRIKKEKN